MESVALVIRHLPGTLLRVQRWQVPEGPWWCGSAVSPYAGATRVGLDIDWIALRAHAVEKADLTWCENAPDLLSREKRLSEPLMIAATGLPEAIHRAGARLLSEADDLRLSTTFVTSTAGAVPEPVPGGGPPGTVVIATWPLDRGELDSRFEEASRWPQWGICVPLLHPVMTGSDVLDELCDAAASRGARFAFGAFIESDPAALASLAMSSDENDAVWDALFDGSAELLAVGAARHLAAAALRNGMAARCPFPPGRSNWAAASRLAAIAERLFQLEKDAELAWLFHRTAGLVASLPKQIARVAEAASLHIVEGLDEPMIHCLEEWLEGSEPEMLTQLDAEWPLARSLYP